MFAICEKPAVWGPPWRNCCSMFMLKGNKMIHSKEMICWVSLSDFLESVRWLHLPVFWEYSPGHCRLNRSSAPNLVQLQGHLRSCGTNFGSFIFPLSSQDEIPKWWKYYREPCEIGKGECQCPSWEDSWLWSLPEAAGKCHNIVTSMRSSASLHVIWAQLEEEEEGNFFGEKAFPAI